MSIYFKPLLHRLFTKSAERGWGSQKSRSQDLFKMLETKAAHDNLAQKVIHVSKWQKPDIPQPYNSANTEKQDH